MCVESRHIDSYLQSSMTNQYLRVLKLHSNFELGWIGVNDAYLAISINIIVCLRGVFPAIIVSTEVLLCQAF